MNKKSILLSAFISGLAVINLLAMPSGTYAQEKHVCSADVAPLKEQAIALLKSENYTAVIPLLSSGLNKEPDCPFMLFNRARSYEYLKEYTKAIADYKATLKVIPESSVSWMNLGKIYMGMNNFAEAENCFTQAVRIKGMKDYYPYFLRSNLYHKQGKQDEAIEDLKRAIQAEETIPELKEGLYLEYCARASKYSKQKNYEAAIVDYTQAINCFSKNGGAYFQRGGTYYRLNRNNEAIADVTKAIELEPNNAGFKAFRSLVYGHRLKDYPNAIQDMKTAMNQDPARQKNSNNYGQLSTWYLLTRDFTNAFSTVNEGLAKYPNDAGLYITRGTIYINKGDKEAAYRDYSKACQLDPNNQYAIKYRNNVAAQLGK